MFLRKCMYMIICTLWCLYIVRCANDKADAKEHELEMEILRQPYKMAVKYENLDDKEYVNKTLNDFINLLASKDFIIANYYVRKDDLRQQTNELLQKSNDNIVLKTELEHVQHKLEIAETKMNLHPYIESKEYDLLPHWLIRMTCSRRLKWVTALKFELTIVAKNLAKRLRENNIDIEYFVTIIIKCIGVKADCHHEELTTWVAPTEKKWKVLAKELGFSPEESNYLWYIVEKTETKVKQIGKTVDYAWMYIGKLNPQSNYATVQNLIKEYLGEYAPRVLDTIHHVENKKFSGEVTVYLQPVTYREAIEIRKKVCEKLGRKQLLCSAYHGTKVFPEAVIQDEEFKDLTSEQPLVPPSEKSGEKVNPRQEGKLGQ